MENLKKSRSSHLRAVTRILNPNTTLLSKDPSTFDVLALTEQLDRVIAKSDDFYAIHDSICNLIVEPDQQAEEQKAADHFEEKWTATCRLLRRLICLHKVYLKSHSLQKDLDSLARSKSSHPDKDHSVIVRRHSTSFKELRTLMEESTIPPDHPYRGDLDRLQEVLSSLSMEDRPDLSTIIHPSTPAAPRSKHIQLPKLSLPTFNGDVMNWATFWSQFSAAVGSNPDLSPINKLTYLREAIKDPTITPLLYCGIKGDDHYEDVVGILKQRFDKQRVIHSTYCKTLINSTAVELISTTWQILSPTLCWDSKAQGSTTSMLSSPP